MITMVRVPRLLRDYISIEICGRRIADWLENTTTDTNEKQVLAHYVIHICLCFRRLQGRLILPNTLPLLGELLFRFDNGRLGDLTASFIEGMYHFVLGRYGHLTELSPNYLSAVSPAYFNLTTRRSNVFYAFTPDLTYRLIPYPFDIPVILQPTEQVAISDNENDEPGGSS